MISTALVLVSGCARFPGGIAPAAVREMSFRIDFKGPINNNYHYYVAIDTNGGDSLGPTPVFPSISGQGWLIGPATHYVEYYQGQYTVHKITNLAPFQETTIGAPLRSSAPSSIGDKSIAFSVDLNDLGATSSSVDINAIATDNPNTPIRMIDGLGLYGTTFISIPITGSRTFAGTDETGDVLDQSDKIVQPASDQPAPLDITAWTISTNM